MKNKYQSQSIFNQGHCKFLICKGKQQGNKFIFDASAGPEGTRGEAINSALEGSKSEIQALADFLKSKGINVQELETLIKQRAAKLLDEQRHNVRFRDDPWLSAKDAVKKAIYEFSTNRESYERAMSTLAERATAAAKPSNTVRPKLELPYPKPKAAVERPAAAKPVDTGARWVEPPMPKAGNPVRIWNDYNAFGPADALDSVSLRNRITQYLRPFKEDANCTAGLTSRMGEAIKQEIAALPVNASEEEIAHAMRRGAVKVVGEEDMVSFERYIKNAKALRAAKPALSAEATKAKLAEMEKAMKTASPAAKAELERQIYEFRAKNHLENHNGEWLTAEEIHARDVADSVTSVRPNKTPAKPAAAIEDPMQAMRRELQALGPNQGHYTRRVIEGGRVVGVEHSRTMKYLMNGIDSSIMPNLKAAGMSEAELANLRRELQLALNNTDLSVLGSDKELELIEKVIERVTGKTWDTWRRQMAAAHELPKSGPVSEPASTQSLRPSQRILGAPANPQVAAETRSAAIASAELMGDAEAIAEARYGKIIDEFIGKLPRNFRATELEIAGIRSNLIRDLSTRGVLTNKDLVNALSSRIADHISRNKHSISSATLKKVEDAAASTLTEHGYSVQVSVPAAKPAGPQVASAQAPAPKASPKTPSMGEPADLEPHTLRNPGASEGSAVRVRGVKPGETTPNIAVESAKPRPVEAKPAEISTASDAKVTVTAAESGTPASGAASTQRMSDAAPTVQGPDSAAKSTQRAAPASDAVPTVGRAAPNSEPATVKAPDSVTPTQRKVPVDSEPATLPRGSESQPTLRRPSTSVGQAAEISPGLLADRKAGVDRFIQGLEKAAKEAGAPQEILAQKIPELRQRLYTAMENLPANPNRSSELRAMTDLFKRNTYDVFPGADFIPTQSQVSGMAKIAIKPGEQSGVTSAPTSAESTAPKSVDVKSTSAGAKPADVAGTGSAGVKAAEVAAKGAETGNAIEKTIQTARGWAMVAEDSARAATEAAAAAKRAAKTPEIAEAAEKVVAKSVEALEKAKEASRAVEAAKALGNTAEALKAASEAQTLAMKAASVAKAAGEAVTVVENGVKVGKITTVAKLIEAVRKGWRTFITPAEIAGLDAAEMARLGVQFTNFTKGVAGAVKIGGTVAKIMPFVDAVVSMFQVGVESYNLKQVFNKGREDIHAQDAREDAKLSEKGGNRGKIKRDDSTRGVAYDIMSHSDALIGDERAKSEKDAASIIAMTDLTGKLREARNYSGELQVLANDIGTATRSMHGHQKGVLGAMDEMEGDVAHALSTPFRAILEAGQKPDDKLIEQHKTLLLSKIRSSKDMMRDLDSQLATLKREKPDSPQISELQSTIRALHFSISAAEKALWAGSAPDVKDQVDAEVALRVARGRAPTKPEAQAELDKIQDYRNVKALLATFVQICSAADAPQEFKNKLVGAQGLQKILADCHTVDQFRTSNVTKWTKDFQREVLALRKGMDSKDSPFAKELETIKSLQSKWVTDGAHLGKFSWKINPDCNTYTITVSPASPYYLNTYVAKIENKDQVKNLLAAKEAKGNPTKPSTPSNKGQTGA